MIFRSRKTYGENKMNEGQNNSDSESDLALGQGSPVEQVEMENSAGNSEERDRAIENQGTTENANPNSEIMNFMRIMMDQ